MAENKFLPDCVLNAIEHAFEGIFVMNPFGEILYANESAKILLGYNEELTNKNFVQLVDGIEEGDVSLLKREDFVNCLESGCTVSRKVVFRTAGNILRVFEAKIRPLVVNGEKFVLLYFREFIPSYAQPEKVRELEKMAMLDYLTGIGNRLYLEQRLKEAILEKELFSVESSVVIIDLDNFKSINDKYGHSVGDAVLKAFSKYLLQSFMSHDCLGRWGGDEFIVILNWILQEDVPKVMERFYKGLKGVSVDVNGKSIKINASSGITSVKRGDTIESILERCDKALYNSKSQGGNKFTIF